jgi:hypothetical protein
MGVLEACSALSLDKPKRSEGRYSAGSIKKDNYHHWASNGPNSYYLAPIFIPEDRDATKP